MMQPEGRSQLNQLGKCHLVSLSKECWGSRWRVMKESLLMSCQGPKPLEALGLGQFLEDRLHFHQDCMMPGFLSYQDAP